MKTVTMRIDDNVYDILKKAADGERRTISNFLENASLQYLSSELYISDSEMNSILNDKTLTEGLYKGIEDAKKGKYRIVE
ncbi:MAG TPA: hypothetical protein PLK90_05295 [Clostridiales bacterium]|nr:hypothetical protein [Clostridiales bacterium]HQP69796.1 hypothetical protein [Clostridiales bacterium]